jgi:hypothetical protein
VDDKSSRSVSLWVTISRISILGGLYNLYIKCLDFRSFDLRLDDEKSIVEEDRWSVFFVLLNSSSLTTPRRAWWDGQDEEMPMKRLDLAHLFTDSGHVHNLNQPENETGYGGNNTYALKLAWGGSEAGERPRDMLYLDIIGEVIDEGSRWMDVAGSDYSIPPVAIAVAADRAAQRMGFEFVPSLIYGDNDPSDRVFFDLWGDTHFGDPEIKKFLEEVVMELSKMRERA